MRRALARLDGALDITLLVVNSEPSAVGFEQGEGIVRLSGKTTDGKQAAELAIDLVVVGIAAE